MVQPKRSFGCRSQRQLPTDHQDEAHLVPVATGACSLTAPTSILSEPEHTRE